MDLARRAAATRPTGSRSRSLAVAHSGWGSQACSLSVDLGAAAAARGDSFSRMAASAGGDGARGWTSRRRGERPRRRPTPEATYGVAARSLAVAHSGWGSQACSLSVDLGAAAAARGDFREWRPAPAAMELEDGPRAAGASGRGGDLRGGPGRLDRWLLRTAVGGLRRALYPLTWVQRQRPAAPTTIRGNKATAINRPCPSFITEEVRFQ